MAQSLRSHAGLSIALLLALAMPDVPSTSVGPERPISEPVVTAPISRQAHAAVAWSGSVFLLVWFDQRQGGRDIFGTRMTAEGEVLDPTGIRLSHGDYQSQPSVAWNGTTFLVVWSDDTSGTSHITGTRVSSDGTVLDPDGISISGSLGPQSGPAVASDGSLFLVTWVERRTGTGEDILGTRVDAGGHVLDTPGRTLVSGVGNQLAPDLAWDGDSYLLVWSDRRAGERDVFGASVSSDGEVTPSGGFRISSGPGDEDAPAVAGGTSGWLVAWQRSNRRDQRVEAARIAADGSVMDPEPIAVSDGSAYWEDNPSTAWTGRHFVVAWGMYDSGVDEILVARIDPSTGEVLEPGGFAVSGAGAGHGGATVTAAGSMVLVAWDATVGDASDIFGARIRRGRILDPEPLLIARAAAAQTGPVLAWNGHVFLVAWIEDRYGGDHLRTNVLGRLGRPLHPEGVVAAPDLLSGTVQPAVASDGEGFMVTWDDFYPHMTVLGIMVSGRGEVLGEPFLIKTRGGYHQDAPAIAWGGGFYLVAWRDQEGVRVARVTATGSVLDPAGIAMPGERVPASRPRVAWNGSHFLVVWERPAGDQDVQLVAALVGPDGEVVEPAPIVIADNGGPAGVASDGNDYLVVWEANYPSSQTQVAAARISGDGRVIDPSPIDVGGHPERLASVAWDGGMFVLTWSEDGNVRVARVSSDGRVLDPAGRLLATSGADRGAPMVAAGPSGFSGVTYVRMATEPLYGSVPRVFFKGLRSPS